MSTSGNSVHVGVGVRKSVGLGIASTAVVTLVVGGWALFQ